MQRKKTLRRLVPQELLVSGMHSYSEWVVFPILPDLSAVPAHQYSRRWDQQSAESSTRKP